MKKLNKKGFTLVELLAVIVVLAIVMSLAVVAITNVLDSTRKNSFVADAKSFLEGAHQLVSSDGVSNLFGPSNGDFAPTCSGGSTDTKYIPISAINLDRGGVTSPYGNKYIKRDPSESSDLTTSVTADKAKKGSYIMVVATTASSSVGCTYSYSIFLTDGVYSIGTAATPEGELTVETSKVKVASGL